MMQHHYIPKFYTKQWTGDDGKLVQFNRPHDEVKAKRKPPAGVGWEENLYALNLPGPLQHWLEQNFLRVVDQQANDALQVMLAGSMDLSLKHRTGWSRFLMSLLSRTPEKIAQVKSMYDEQEIKTRDKLEAAYDEAHAQDLIPPSPEQKAREIAEQNAIAVGRLIQRVMDLPRPGQHILNMFWDAIDVGVHPRNFLTSDNPAFLSLGLQHEESFLSLPISPQKLFVAANKKEVLDRMSALASQDLIRMCNETSVRRASRFVYGTDCFQINFVERNLSAIGR